MKDYEQLMRLKLLTAETGLLHDAQIFQFKLYPLIMTHATKSTFSVDFDFKTLIYNITETKGRPPSKFIKRLEFLSKSTQDLLGDDWTIVVKVKDKDVFTLTGN